MMDSNEIRPLTEVAVQEAAEVAAVTEVIATSIQSKEEVIARLQVINQQEELADKAELDALKQTFYRLRNAEVEAARKTFEENGGNPEAFVSPKDEFEAQFKEFMGSIREKRNAAKAQEEQEKQDNLDKKLAIIERMKELAESPEDANKAYNEFKKLQAEWNEIKNIPIAKANELWKSYQLHSEKFYDLIKLNNEFREYDFKKNLEIKVHLCEAAEKLAEEEDVISAFHQLQKLHQEFREAGPVAKEQREEIWNRFKAASTTINRRHQQHFEGIKEKEQRNLDEKTVICEIVESMEYDKMLTFQDWHDKTEEILALQAKWKTIGFAPQKMNTKIFERFRKACDDFFKRKAEHFKSIKGSMNENLEKKKAIIEKLELINQEAAPSEKAGNTIRSLMKEWNSIGHVPFKEKDKIYKQYRAVVDALFNKLNMSASKKKLSNFKSSLSKETNMYREREKLVRTYENLKNEIKTYENNIGFLTSSSKKGNSLVTEMNRRIEKLKADLELITQKIAVIDESMKA